MDDPNYFDEILLVEDNPGDVRLAKEMLADGGLDPTVHVVTNGSEAIDFVRRRGDYADAPRPDAILLDLHLPRMGGAEVVAEIRDDVADVPIIALSGSREEVAFEREGIADEVDAYVVKPIEPDTLEDVARSLRE